MATSRLEAICRSYIQLSLFRRGYSSVVEGRSAPEVERLRGRRQSILQVLLTINIGIFLKALGFQGQVAKILFRKLMWQERKPHATLGFMSFPSCFL